MISTVILSANLIGERYYIILYYFFNLGKSCEVIQKNLVINYSFTWSHTLLYVLLYIPVLFLIIMLVLSGI